MADAAPIRLVPTIVNIASQSVTTEATIYTPTTGTKFRILEINVTATGGSAGMLVLKDTTAVGGTVSRTWAIPVTAITALTGASVPQFKTDYPKEPGILSGKINNVLTGTLSGVTITGYIKVVEE